MLTRFALAWVFRDSLWRDTDTMTPA